MGFDQDASYKILGHPKKLPEYLLFDPKICCKFGQQKNKTESSNPNVQTQATWTLQHSSTLLLATLRNSTLLTATLL